MPKMLVHIEGVRPRWPREQRIPLELRRLVERCLARQPEARPANMHALDLELERVAVALVRKAEQVLRSPHRPVTEIGIGWPTTAIHISRHEAQVPVRPRDGTRDRSWSGMDSTVPAAFTP